jgi:hypothetical protein
MKTTIFGIAVCCGVLLLISGCVPELPPWSKPAITVVSRYTFDTGSGTIDSGPGGYTGKLIGSPELAEGKSGKGLKLDGKKGMTIPNGAITVGRSFTAAAWFKLDSGAPQAPYRILSVGCLAGSSITGFVLAVDTSYGRGCIDYRIGGERFRINQFSFESRDGKWHHIAVAFDLDNRRAVGYIDGQKDSETPLPGSANPSPMAGIDNCIGGYYQSSIGEGVYGVLDDVVVINGFLGEQDIPHIMDGTIF